MKPIRVTDGDYDKFKLIRLCTGEIIMYNECQENGEFLRLCWCCFVYPDALRYLIVPHGMDVRRDAIIWQAMGGRFERS